MMKGAKGAGPRHGLSTRSVQGSREELSGPVVPSIVRASTFFFTGSPGETREDLYARYGNNPNQTAVARKMADLEGMEAALALGSGMAAVSMTLLALLRTGDHVVASRFLYGDTHRFVTEELSRRGISATLVNPESGREWREAMGKRTRVLFLEIPTNPALRIFDLRPMAKLAEEAGVSLVVDATFASPVNFRPAELGADVVIHSATKYLSGHSDLVAGIVSGSRGLVEEVREMLKLYGPALDPQAAWLLDRGLRTLAVRVERQNESAGALARWLQERPGVERVVYPGLESHRDHRLAREIFDGFGGILGIELSGGGKTADRFCQALEVGNAAPSLGGVETLVSQPRYTSHRGLTSAELRKAGISGSFVRISVGLEDVEDLQVDFERGLRAAAGEG